MALKVGIFSKELSSRAFRKFVELAEDEPVVLYHQRMRLVEGEALPGQLYFGVVDVVLL